MGSYDGRTPAPPKVINRPYVGVPTCALRRRGRTVCETSVTDVWCWLAGVVADRRRGWRRGRMRPVRFVALSEDGQAMVLADEVGHLLTLPIDERMSTML